MAYKSGQVTATTTATLVCTPGAVPDNDGVLINSSVAAFLGPAGVTTATGFPIGANSPLLVPTTGAASEALFAVVTSGTATVSYLFPG